MNAITLAPRYSLRVEDFRDHHALAVRCEGCGHEGLVSAAHLRRQAPAYLRIVQLADQLRCSKCRGRSLIAWWTVELVEARKPGRETTTSDHGNNCM